MNKSTLKVTKKNLGSKFVVIQIIINIFLISLCQLYDISSLIAVLPLYPFCCLLLLLIIWTFYSWYIVTKSLFNPYLLFFLSAAIFNGGQAILEVFHLNKDGILATFRFTPTTLLSTIFFVTICLSFFHLGALICASIEQNISKNRMIKISPNLEIYNSKSCYIIGKCLFYISILPTLIVFQRAASVVNESGYMGLYDKEYSTSVDTTGPEILHLFIITSSMFLLVGSKYKIKSKVISMVIMIIYGVIRLILGQRNQAIMPLISFAWLWNQSISPIPKTLLFSVVGIMTTIVFPVIAITRNTTGEERLSLDYLVEAYSTVENPLIAAVSEMGGSMLTVAYTIELVPKVRAFQMGVEYLYALLTLIPNFFGGSLHPSIARGFPDAWLVSQVDRNFAAGGGSFGFSFIAEAYLNFGWFGGFIFLGLLGFMFAKFTFWATRDNDFAKMAMLASFISFFLFYPRGASVFMVRPLVWYSLFPFWGAYIINKAFVRQAYK